MDFVSTTEFQSCNCMRNLQVIYWKPKQDTCSFKHMRRHYQDADFTISNPITNHLATQHARHARHRG